MPGVHGALAQNHVVLALDNDQGVTSRKQNMAAIIAQESLLPPKLVTLIHVQVLDTKLKMIN